MDEKNHKAIHSSAIQREKNFREMGAHVPDRYMGSYYSSPNPDMNKWYAPRFASKINQDR